MSSIYSHRTEKAYADIERYFLGRHVKKFRGQLLLNDALTKIMKFGYDDVSRSIWGDWLDVLVIIKAEDIKNGAKVLSYSQYGGHPFGGMLNDIQIASCITTPLDSEIEQQFIGICMLLLQKILLEDSAERLGNFARMLRYSSQSSHNSYGILKSLPVYNGNLVEFKHNILSTLSDIPGRDDEEDVTAYIKGIEKLAKIQVSESSVIDEPLTQSGFIHSELVENVDEEIVPNEVRTVINIDEVTGEIDKWYIVQEEKREEENQKLRPKIAAEAATKLTRYWLRRFNKLTEVDKACLTVHEKRRLVSFIEDGLESSSNEKFLAALWVAIAYLTPLSFMDARNVLTDAKYRNVTLNGEYVLDILPFEYGYKYAQESLDECYITASLMVMMLHRTLNDAFIRLKAMRGQSILDKLGLEFKGIDDIVDLELDALRANGQFRLTKRRISYAFKAAVSYLERNPIISYYLSCDEKHAPPMLLYYGSIKVDQIRNVYSEVLSHLMVSDSFEMVDQEESGDIYAKAIIKESAVFEYATALYAHVSIVVKGDGSKIWERHNAYTDYIVAVLMHATGHRPVRDPFESVAGIDLRTGLLLINDKCMDEARAYRLVALPKIAVQQLEQYCHYLEQLSVMLIKRGKASHDLSKAIRMVLSRVEAKQVIPFFFYLDEGLNKTLSVTKESIGGFLGLVTWGPDNYSRHINATALLQKRHWAQRAEIQMGHIEGVDHPFGSSSELVPIDELYEVAKVLDNTMVCSGWKVMPSILKNKINNIKGNKAATKNVKDIHESKAIGVALRQINRKVVNGKYAALVRDVIGEKANMSDLGKISTKDVDDIVIAIALEAKERGLLINRSIKLFYIWLGRAVSSNSKLFYLRKAMVVPEPSPFKKDTINLYNQMLEGRERFIKYLELSGKSGEVVTAETRLSELIVSAALFGCLASAGRIKDICSAIFKRCYCFEGEVFLDLMLISEEKSMPDKNVFRWFPDDVSLALISGFHHLNRSNDHTINGLALHNALVVLVKKLNLDFKKKNIWAQLAQLAESALLVEAPGYLRAILSEKNYSSSIPLNSYVRVASGKRIKRVKKKSKAIEFRKHILSINVSGSEASRANRNSTGYMDEMSLAFKNSLKIEVKANVKFNKRVKTELEINVKKVVGNGECWNEIDNLLALWAIFMCKFGTKHKRVIKFNTIKKYYFMVANALIDLVGPGSILTMNAEKIEELYIKSTGYDARNNPAEFVGRIREFHFFLAEHWPVESPEWGVIYAYAGGAAKLSGADANYITEEEYIECFIYISNCGELKKLERLQYSVILLLGYRFGLRFDEAYRIQWRDVQHDVDYKDVVILVNDNAFGDTKSAAGVRVVPETLRLTTVERDALRTLRNEFEDGFDYDSQQGLMSELGSKRKLIDDALASMFINEVIRNITGDDLLHFHHCRHSFVNNIWNGDFNCKRYANDSLLKEFTLREAAVVLGHVSEETMLGSYIHKVDKVLSCHSKRITPELNAHILAYAAEINYETAKKRISRNKVINKSVVDLLQMKKLLLSPDTRFDKRVSTKIELNRAFDLTLNDIGLVVQATTSISKVDDCDMQKSVIANRFMLSSKAVDSIIQAASYVEGKSGYNLFNMEKHDQSILFDGNSDNKDFQVGKEESFRLKSLLSQSQKALDSLGEEERKAVTESLNIWVKGYDLASNDVLVSDINDVSKYRSGLAALGFFDLKYTIAVPKELESKRGLIAMQLGEGFELITSSIRFAHEKTVRRRRSRLKVGIHAADTAFKTKTSFAMLMFLVSVGENLPAYG